jgi:hypothetical protein
MCLVVFIVFSWTIVWNFSIKLICSWQMATSIELSYSYSTESAMSIQRATEQWQWWDLLLQMLNFRRFYLNAFCEELIAERNRWWSLASYQSFSKDHYFFFAQEFWKCFMLSQDIQTLKIVSVTICANLSHGCNQLGIF